MENYAATDYRSYIIDRVNSRKKMNSKFTLSRLARHLGVEATYVTRVLKGRAQFNSDQLFLACEFLELTEEESAFLELLLEYDRAYVPKRKKALLQKIRRIQDERRKTEKNIRAPVVRPEPKGSGRSYYLNPFAQIVHICLTVLDFRDKPRLVQEALRLTDRQFEEILASLKNLELIQMSGGKVTSVKDHVNLSTESDLHLPNQILLRSLSAERALRLPPDQKYSFAVTFSATEATRRAIQDEFMAFLKRIEREVRAAEAKSVFQLNFELFPWLDSVQLSRGQDTG